jgi:hypothetical protein
MKTLDRSAVLVLVSVLAAGCVQKSAPTVEYFRAHREERVAQLARCANDPGSLATTPACVNAQQAADLEQRDSLRNLPSMGLKPEGAPEQQSSTKPAQ